MFLKIDESSEGFLTRGIIVATFRKAGMEPVKRHLLGKDTKLGPTDSRIHLKNLG